MLLPPGLVALSPAVYLLPTVRRARCSCTFPIRLRLFLFPFLSFKHGQNFPGFMRPEPPSIRKWTYGSIHWILFGWITPKGSPPDKTSFSSSSKIVSPSVCPSINSKLSRKKRKTFINLISMHAHTVYYGGRDRDANCQEVWECFRDWGLGTQNCGLSAMQSLWKPWFGGSSVSFSVKYVIFSWLVQNAPLWFAWMKHVPEEGMGAEGPRD